ncbi:MAG: 50S ribosomal protein L29 [Candidatus Kaiserbacteria bacterium]|nr:50S ribosomal protein L29 [Candidatus Kaiserbacteria bacterium]
MTKRESMTTKTEQELSKLLADTRALLRTERFAAAGARPKDSNSPKKFRAEIARILTEQSARSLSSGSATRSA